MSVLRHNRPLRRYVARFYCQLRYGRSHSHAEDWWPSLRLHKAGREGEEGRIAYRGRTVARLMAYPAPLGGTGELIVVGSGPSLASQAAGRIPIESALLVNGAIHLLGNSGRKPFGVLVEDERFVWRHWQTLTRMVPPQTDCYFSTSVIRALCETAPEWLALQNIRHLNFVHRPYGAARPDDATLRNLPFLCWSADRKAGISLSPETGVVLAGSVAVTATQLAVALRPARVGLAGVDLTGTNSPRFYETAGDTAMTRLDAARETILSMFRLLAEESTRQGIAIENYSPVSLLARVNIPYVGRLEAKQSP